MTSEFQEMRSKTNDLEEKIMEIVYRMVDNNQILDFNRIYNLCINELKVDSSILFNILENLQEKKRIIFGGKVIRDFILNNDVRKSIYYYLKSNPGVKFSEIVEFLHLSANYLQWNLSILMRHNCIQMINLGKFKIFGLQEQHANALLIEFLMRNDTYRNILTLLGSLNMSVTEIALKSNIEYKKLQYNIKYLQNANVLQNVIEGSEIKVKINPKYISILKCKLLH